MAEKALTLQIVVDDKGTPVVKQFAGEVGKAADAMDSKASKSTKTLNDGLGKLTSGFGAALKTAAGFATGLLGVQTGVAALSGAFNSMKSFQAELSNVNTLLKDSPVTIEHLRQELLQLPPALGSSTELAKGLYDALSAGVEPAKAVAFVGEAAKLAKGGLTETNTAVKVLTATMDAYGLGAEHAGHVSDVLFTAVRLGKTTMDELASNIGNVLPVASNLGVTFEETTATVTTLTKVFPSTSQAVTGLRSVLSGMIQNMDKFRAVGIDIKAVIAEKGLTGAIEALKTATGGSAEKVREFIPDVEGLTAILGLMGAQLVTQKQNVNAFGDVTGAANEAFAKSQDNATEAWKRFTNTIDRLIQQHAPPLLAAFTKLADFLTNNLGPAVNFVKTAWEAVNFAFSKVVEYIAWGYSKIFQVLETIVGKLKSVADALGFDGVAAKLASVERSLGGVKEELGRISTAAAETANEWLLGTTTMDRATKQTGQTLKEVMKEALEASQKSFETLQQSGKASHEQLAKAAQEQIALMKAYYGEIPEAAKPKFEELVKIAQGITDPMGKAGQDAGAAFASGIASGATSAYEHLTSITDEVIAAINRTKSVIKDTNEIFTRNADGTYTNANGLNGGGGPGASSTGAPNTPDATPPPTPNATPQGAPGTPPAGRKAPDAPHTPRARPTPPTDDTQTQPWSTPNFGLGSQQFDPVKYTYASTEAGLTQQIADIRQEMGRLNQSVALVGRDSRALAAGATSAYLTQSRAAWQARLDETISRLDAFDPVKAHDLAIGNIGGSANGRRILDLANGRGDEEPRQGATIVNTMAGRSVGGGVYETHAAGQSYTRAGDVAVLGNGEAVLSRDLAEGLRQLVAGGSGNGGEARSVTIQNLNLNQEFQGVDPRAIDGRAVVSAILPALREALRRGELVMA